MSSAINLHRHRFRRPLRIRGTGYRLQYRFVTRVSWTMLLVFTTLFFAPIPFEATFDLWWRSMAVLAVACGVAGLRVLWGAAVVVGERGLRIYRPWWPLRRDLAWHRILATDIIPGFWFLEIEMNSGERIELPCVEHMDRLFDQIEEYRTRLDVV